MGKQSVCAIMLVRILPAKYLERKMDIPQGKHQPIELLRYAGLFLWFCAGIPLLLMHQIFPEPLESTAYIAWFLLHGLFGMMYWNLTRYLPERTDTVYRLLYLSILTGSALGISAVSQTLLGGILLLIVAVILPWMLSVTPAVSWLIAQNILLAITFMRVPDVTFFRCYAWDWFFSWDIPVCIYEFGGGDAPELGP